MRDTLTRPTACYAVGLSIRHRILHVDRLTLLCSVLYIVYILQKGGSLCLINEMMN